MKVQKTGIVLGVFCGLLWAIFLALYLQKDATAPVIQKIEEFSYDPSMTAEELLAKVSAKDGEDGEVTSLVVEKVVTDEKTQMATITYGAMDQAKNIAKYTLTVPLEITPTQSREENREETNPGEEIEASQDTETPEETEAPEETETDNQNEPEAGQPMGGLPAAGKAAEGETTQGIRNVGSNPNPGRPSLVFKKQQITIQKGENPNWVGLIDTFRDDKDNQDYLEKHIKVDGEYNRNQAGTYEVQITVTDSDGNVSNAYPITLVVE